MDTYLQTDLSFLCLSENVFRFHIIPFLTHQTKRLNIRPKILHVLDRSHDKIAKNGH